MNYYMLFQDSDRYSRIEVEFDVVLYRKIASEMLFGKPFVNNVGSLPHDVPEAVKATIEQLGRKWHWIEKPAQIGHANISFDRGDSAFYFFDPVARQAMEPLLKGCGEFVDIGRDGEELYLYVSTLPRYLESPSPECPHWFGHYVSEEFVRVYKENNLKGLLFAPVDAEFRRIPQPRKIIDVQEKINEYKSNAIDAREFVNTIFDILADAINDDTAGKMRRVPKDLRVFWCAYRYESELGNGGMAQTFTNMGHLLPCAEEAYRALGKTEQAQLIAQQIALLHEAGITLKTSEDWWDLPDEDDERLDALWESDKYSDLDADWEDFHDPVCLAEYVVAHPKRFVELKQE